MSDDKTLSVGLRNTRCAKTLEVNLPQCCYITLATDFHKIALYVVTGSVDQTQLRFGNVIDAVNILIDIN